MIRSFDAYALNFYLNHSSIYPQITKDDNSGYLDASWIVENPDNYLFLFNGGSLIFLKKDDNFTMDGYFLPRKRGAFAKSAAKESILYMFSQGAKKIIAEVPDFNRPSQMMIGSLGFKKTRTEQGVWLKNGINYDLGIYELCNGQYC